MPEVYDIMDLDLDRWEGWPGQRDELLDYITGEEIRGVLFVSGDFHHCTLARVEADGDRSRIFEVLVGPAGSNLNPAGILIMDGLQFPWSEAEWNCTRFQMSPEGLARITWVRDSGEVIAEALLDDLGNILELEWVALEH
jgi:hypothetical protein